MELDELINILKEWKRELEAIDKTKTLTEKILAARNPTKKMWKNFSRKFIEYRKEVYKKCQQQLEEK